ncbi:MAG TPA: hypothetical protein VGD43_21230 [Micromonospora sp.]
MTLVVLVVIGTIAVVHKFAPGILGSLAALGAGVIIAEFGFEWSRHRKGE